MSGDAAAVPGTAPRQYTAGAGERKGVPTTETQKIALSPYFPGSVRYAKRYVINEGHRLARGSTASVYVALDEWQKRIVALKLLHRRWPDEPYEQFEERLVRFRVETEVYSAARAAYPDDARYIIETLDADATSSAERPYHAMALADGSLRDLLSERTEQRSPLPAKKVLRWASQIARGLHAAQRCGYVHRDVKPENLLLVSNGGARSEVRVTDFGIAKLAEERTTQAGRALPIGTWGYMAPEQILRGVDRAEEHSDVWSMGVVVFELFTLFPCWRGGGAAGLRQEALNGLTGKGSERAKRHWAQTDKLTALDGWLARCLARAPESRYQSPLSAVSALEQILETAGLDLNQPLVAGSRAPTAAAANGRAAPALSKVPELQPPPQEEPELQAGVARTQPANRPRAAAAALATTRAGRRSPAWLLVAAAAGLSIPALLLGSHLFSTDTPNFTAQQATPQQVQPANATTPEAEAALKAVALIGSRGEKPGRGNALTASTTAPAPSQDTPERKDTTPAPKKTVKRKPQPRHRPEPKAKPKSRPEPQTQPKPSATRKNWSSMSAVERAKAKLREKAPKRRSKDPEGSSPGP